MYLAMIGIAWALQILLGAVEVDPQVQAKTVRARTILQLVIDKQYEEFAATGTEQVKAAMDAGKAAEIWAGITAQYGAYQSEIASEAKLVSGHGAVNFACRFERGTATLMAALDNQERMAGFRIVRADRDAPYQASDYVDASAFREEKATVSAGEFPLPGTRGEGPSKPAEYAVAGHVDKEVVADIAEWLGRS